jgi:AcrR family transcriptional regulator
MALDADDPIRARILRAAREQFARRGYDDVTPEAVAAAAGVPAAAVDERFPTRETLFAAVHEEVERALLGDAALAAVGGGNPWDGILAGVRAYLDGCLDPAVMRISLVDAPRVIGWPRWRAVAEQYGLGPIVLALREGVAGGHLRPHDEHVFGHLLLGLLAEAGLMIAGADDPRAERDRVEAGVVQLLSGVRAEASERPVAGL